MSAHRRRNEVGKTIEFWFDFGSPTAYLAWTQLPALARRAGAELAWRPMLLGGVFKATGNRAPGEIAAKGAWMRGDLRRWARKWGVALNPNPHFPVNTLRAMRGAVAAQRAGELAAYAEAMFRAMWIDGKNVAEPEIFAAVVSGAGFDAAAYAERIADPEIKQALIAATEEAVSRGVFGAPTMIVEGELFFGQDRLDFVADAAAA